MLSGGNLGVSKTSSWENTTTLFNKKLTEIFSLADIPSTNWLVEGCTAFKHVVKLSAAAHVPKRDVFVEGGDICKERREDPYLGNVPVIHSLSLEREHLYKSLVKMQHSWYTFRLTHTHESYDFHSS